MRTALLLGAGLLGLAACNPWDDLRNDSYSELDEALWDPAVVSAEDGVYVRLPRAGRLIRANSDGTHDVVDLGAWAPTRLLGTPDRSAVLAFTAAPVCDTDDPKIETVEDCLSELSEDYLSYRYGLPIVKDGAETSRFDLKVPFNTVEFTADGQKAVAYVDFDAGLDFEEDGVTNLTEVLFIDLASDVVRSVPVGFSAERVLFNADQTRAVVLSRSQVAVVELDSGEYDTLVTFPLTLDADDSVSPQDAALTPDGRYALVTVQGSGDLYILDLEVEAINLVSLPAAPSDMLVDAEADRTVLVYSGRSQVDVLEHDYFELRTLELDEPATDLAALGGSVVLYNVSSSDRHDVYRLDLEDNEVVEMPMENPVTSLELAPDLGTAVAFLRPEKSTGSGLTGYYDERYGVALVDLYGEDVITLSSGSQPLGLAFAGGDVPSALVLLEGDDDLLQLDLGSGGDTSIRLEAPPLDIGSFGELFYITHDTTVGMISFLDPASGETRTTSNFALSGVLDDDETPLLLDSE